MNDSANVKGELTEAIINGDAKAALEFVEGALEKGVDMPLADRLAQMCSEIDREVGHIERRISQRERVPIDQPYVWT